MIGNTFWQLAYKEKDKLDGFNHEFIDRTESTLKAIMIGFQILGALLSIFVWKYRKFAKYLIYGQLISLIIQGFIPAFNDQVQRRLTTEICLTFFLLASNIGLDIIAATSVFFIKLCFVAPILLKETITVEFLCSNLLLSAFVFAIFSVFGMLLVYIA